MASDATPAFWTRVYRSVVPTVLWPNRSFTRSGDTPASVAHWPAACRRSWRRTCMPAATQASVQCCQSARYRRGDDRSDHPLPVAFRHGDITLHRALSEDMLMGDDKRTPKDDIPMFRVGPNAERGAYIGNTVFGGDGQIAHDDGKSSVFQDNVAVTDEAIRSLGAEVLSRVTAMHRKGEVPIAMVSVVRSAFEESDGKTKLSRLHDAAKATAPYATISSMIHEGDRDAGSRALVKKPKKGKKRATRQPRAKGGRLMRSGPTALSQPTIDAMPSAARAPAGVRPQPAPPRAVGVLIASESRYGAILGCSFDGHDQMVENHGRDIFVARNTLDRRKRNSDR